MGRYPEKPLQLQAIGWLARHRGYVGCFSDEEGRGARMDAAGLLDGRLVLIEVKTNAHAGLLRPGPDGAGPIECKVAATLADLHRCADTPLASAAAAVWDRRRAPLVVLLAERWSANAREGLRTVFERRARDWCFDWEFWRWTDDRVETIAAGAAPAFDGAATPTIPALRATPGRASARTIDELRSLAVDRGVGDLFDRFLSAASAAGLRSKPGRETVAATTRRIAGQDTATVFAAYLGRSSPGRLAVGCVREWLDATPADLPGAPSPEPFGFLNEDRFLTESSEIDRLFTLPLRFDDRSAR